MFLMLCALNFDLDNKEFHRLSNKYLPSDDSVFHSQCLVEGKVCRELNSGCVQNRRGLG